MINTRCVMSGMLAKFGTIVVAGDRSWQKLH